MMWAIFPLVFLAGFVDAIAGGGGIISVTAYLAVGLPAHLALGTNKFSAVLGTGISMARFAKNGYVRWDAAVAALMGALAGSALGANLALFLEERVLTYILIAALPVVALLVLFNRGFGMREKSLSHNRVLVYSLLVGFGIGGYDGFFGPGTGTFLIMAFTAILGLNVLTACGNAKVVNFASNMGAVVTFLLNGQVDFRLGIPCALCGILGQYLGSGLAMKKGVAIVRPMILVMILVLLGKVVWDLVR